MGSCSLAVLVCSPADYTNNSPPPLNPAERPIDGRTFPTGESPDIIGDAKIHWMLPKEKKSEVIHFSMLLLVAAAPSGNWNLTGGGL